jgi:hypothetical protein
VYHSKPLFEYSHVGAQTTKRSDITSASPKASATRLKDANKAVMDTTSENLIVPPACDS